MNYNNYRKIVHSSLWFGSRIALSKRLKEGYHKGFWQDSGGKVEEGESLIDAVMRETEEETKLVSSYSLQKADFNLVDCFIYPERELKTFLFEVRLYNWYFKWIENPEPAKQSNWELFTIRKALKLKLMPSVRYYLEGLQKPNQTYSCWQDRIYTEMKLNMKRLGNKPARIRKG